MDKIVVRDLVKKFGKVMALDNFSFKVERGDIVSLLGPSGCGKTTCLRAIGGLEKVDAGEILIDGELLTAPAKKVFVPPEKRNLGLVFQTYALWPHMKIRENIAYGLAGRSLTKQEKNKRIESVLELVGLTGLENRYPSQLSGGQQQRVALARNLAYEPRVLLLDEPLSNLDFKVRERTRGELYALLKRIGITALYVTHDQEEAFVISDRVILMNEGKRVQEGEPRELYEKPSNLFVADFIGRANILKAKTKSINEQNNTARIEVPEMGVELICNYDCRSFPETLSLVLIRHNEIEFCGAVTDFQENVVEGKVEAREYRGASADHKVRVGNCNIFVTTQGDLLKHPQEEKVYLHISPKAVKPIHC